MREKGVDMVFNRPKSIEEAASQGAPDMVITMGCGDACPVYPGAHVEEWDLPDPSKESIDFMRAKGLELDPGAFAENITTKGIDLASLPVGTRLIAGETELEVTQIGKKCHQGCAIFKQVGDCIMPREGIFAKVITPGIIRPGDSIEIKDDTAANP